VSDLNHIFEVRLLYNIKKRNYKMKNNKNGKTNDTGVKILHGNQARIDPKRKVIPAFQSSVTNDFRNRPYTRLDEYELARLDIEEVDSNPLS
jgi:hypothetical protein